MNYSARGNKADLYVSRILEAEGWCIGSRRHTAGPGDLLAVRHERLYHDVRLIEVKTTERSPWNDFGPADRRALSQEAQRIDATAWVAWKPPRKPLTLIPEEDWPDDRSAAHERESGPASPGAPARQRDQVRPGGRQAKDQAA